MSNILGWKVRMQSSREPLNICPVRLEIGCLASILVGI